MYDLFPKYFKNCMLQGHNEQECKILHPELKATYEKNIKKEVKYQQGDTESSLTKAQVLKRYIPNRKWNPIKRMFINKGCLSEKVVTPDKGIGNTNSFSKQTKGEEEHIEDITSMVTAKIIEQKQEMQE